MVVLLILLTWWQELPEPETPHQVIEFYAGVGRIAALAQYTGYKSVAVDLEYGKSFGLERGSRPPMDINSNAGLMWLVGDSGFVFPFTIQNLQTMLVLVDTAILHTINK